MKMFDKYRSARMHVIVGATAIISSGIMLAFLASQPSRFAMWMSAYMVLVVGVMQIFLGTAQTQLTPPKGESWKWWFFGLFNLASISIITGTALKYAAINQNIFVTGAGTALMLAALLLFGWQIRMAKSTWFKRLTLMAVAMLAGTAVIGLMLAGRA